jgi:hypothetical protein
MATRRTSTSPRTADPVTPVGPAESTRAPRSPSASAESRPAQRRPGAAQGQPAPLSKSPVAVSADTRRSMIAKAAYLRSERRGFAPGFEEEDWLTAEKEVDALLSAGQSAPQ